MCKTVFMQAFESVKAVAVAEYLLLITPHEDLSNRIRLDKQSFFEKYKAPEAVRGKPHLTLVRFTQFEGAEERIRQRLRHKAAEWMPFWIELTGYGSFPSHTIYLNVATKTGIQNLVKSIRTDSQALMKLDKDNKPHFILEPHITIARRLRPWQYEAGWLEYRDKHFNGKFMANAMTLLKRSTAETPYKTVERFEFKGQPVIAKQGVMF